MAEENRLPTEDELRKRVEKRFKARGDLFTHVGVFIAANIMVWMIWLLTGADFLWPALVTGPWAFGLLMHFVTYYVQVGGWAERREDMIEREVERERSRIYGSGSSPKRKNDEMDDGPPVRLTGDGEFTESYIDEINRNERPKNG